VVSVLDVAAFILQERGSMTAWKLQKLVYYCQAWSLVWDEQPLFPEKIEAWANGPVVRELFQLHRGQFIVSSLPHGELEKLGETQKETIRAILDYYGDKPSQWLSDLTHMEEPWRKARVGLLDEERGDREITHDSMAEYYSSLLPDE
jgi:uncharacterized phage-associated protein